MHATTRRRALGAAIVTGAVVAATLGAAHVATAVDALPPPLDGTAPIVVSLGDSYISGEAGRWAGNSLLGLWGMYKASDTGADAYLDAGDRESIPGCHRSKAAEIHFGVYTKDGDPQKDVLSVNLACSGAVTFSDFTKEGQFKPGIDFYRAEFDGVEYRGQAADLYRVAASNNTLDKPKRVKMVVLSIGGNDFGFGPTVAACVQDFVVPWKWADRCSDDPAIRMQFSDKSASARQQQIKTAILNVVKAMTDAGYEPADWSLVVQDYPSPIATSDTIRYGQWNIRQSEGGCPIWDVDLNWANSRALGIINQTIINAVNEVRIANPNVRLMDLSAALMGRRLCEQGTDLVGGTATKWYTTKKWTDPGAVDKSEWVAQIRLESFIRSEGVYQLQESLHPNYWGQLAYHACLRAMWNDGAMGTSNAACVRGGDGTDINGNPHMRLLVVGPGSGAQVFNDPDGWVYGPEQAPTPEPTPTVTIGVPGPAVTVTAPPTPGPTVTVTAPPAPAVTVTATPAMPTVSGLKLTSPAPGKAVATWAPGPGVPVTGYEYRITRPDRTWTSWSSTRTTTVTWTGKPSGTQLTLQVRALKNDTVGPVSVASVTIR